MGAALVSTVTEQEYDRASPPQEVQMVEFPIAGRYVSLLGWCGLFTFHSPCAEYSPERVERWLPQNERMDFAALELAQAQQAPGPIEANSLSVCPRHSRRSNPVDARPLDRADVARRTTPE